MNQKPTTNNSAVTKSSSREKRLVNKHKKELHKKDKAIHNLEDKITKLTEQLNVVVKENKLYFPSHQKMEKLSHIQTELNLAKKRHEEEKKYASLPFISKIIEPLEWLDASIKQNKKNSDASNQQWIKGFEMISIKIHSLLDNEGLVLIIPKIGANFDHYLHQSIEAIESKKYHNSEVLEVIRPGYQLFDRVVRPAMVKIAAEKKQKPKKHHNSKEGKTS